jgi:hypothetical protein
MSSGGRGMTFEAHVAVHEWLGDEIQLWFDPRNLRVFDRVTRENVSLEADRAP